MINVVFFQYGSSLECLKILPLCSLLFSWNFCYFLALVSSYFILWILPLQNLLKSSFFLLTLFTFICIVYFIFLFPLSQKCCLYFMNATSSFTSVNILMMFSFLMFASSCIDCFPHIADFFLFVWSCFSMPQAFFRYWGIWGCLLIFKAVRCCFKALHVCFGIHSWLWASLTALSLRRFWCQDAVYSVLLIAFPREDLSGLPSVDTWRALE